LSRVVAGPAPAKLNLGLAIVGRRDDGYHLLESIFLPLALADQVVVECTPGRPGVRLVLQDASADVPADERNLAVRAARAFVEAAGVDDGIEIRLTKRIPSGGGLGGGSSDAAFVLRALASLRPGRVSAERLAELALALGADVPYFLAPRPALVSGIGERIEPLEGLPELPVLLANPGEAVATAAVFREYAAGGPALTADSAGPTMRSPREALAGGAFSPRELLAALGREGLRNDLEAAATRLCPRISILLQQLRELGASHTGMSGSGATVYGLFEEPAAAEAARERGRREGVFGDGVWAVRTRTLAGP